MLVQLAIPKRTKVYMYIDVQWRVHVDRVLPKKLVVLRGAVHDGNEALQWDYH